MMMPTKTNRTSRFFIDFLPLLGPVGSDKNGRAQ